MDKWGENMTTLPSGREVDIEELEEKIRISWFEGGIPHQIEINKNASLEEIDKACERYLYGYTDEGGEHIDGFFDIYKKEDV